MTHPFRITIALASITAAVFAVGSAQSAPGPKAGDKRGDDRPTILVKFVKPGYDNDDLVQQDGDQAVGSIGNLKTKTVIVKLKRGADIAEKVAEYEARDDVLYAEANDVMSVSDDPLPDATSQGGGAAATADPTAQPADPTTDTTTQPASDATAQAAQDATAQITDSQTSQQGGGGNGQSGLPNDPYFGQQWGSTALHLVEAWPLAPGNFHAPEGPPIAIVDSGVDSLHEDLYGKVATDLGANCLTGVCASDGAADDYGHGTHVAGIAAARADDGVGVAGVAYNAPIIPVKVLDATGSGSYASIASGIIWATDQGARVINLSLGGSAYSQTVCDAVGYAVSHSAVVVAAAGNYGTSTAFYPAACTGAIGVAAIDSTDTRASFSETSYPNVFVSAPGVAIVSDFPGSTYRSDSGTSMAAPFVTGLADLLLAQNPGRQPRDVKMMLAGTADKIGTSTYGSDPYATCGCTWNGYYGYGRVNAYRALTEPPPAAAPDFTMSTAASTLTVARGTKGTATVSSLSDSGFASSVVLSVSGVPYGVTASFVPTTIAGVGSSTLSLTASTSAPYGTYTVTIKGTSGTLVRTTQLTLVVPSPDYTLKLSATSATIVQSEKGTTAVSLNNLFGFKSTTYLAVSGAPAGVTTTLSRTSVSGTTAATLTIATALTAAPGTYDLTITGTSGSLVRTAVYTFTIALAVPDFTLASATTSTSVRYGRATTISYKLTLMQKYGFRGPVTMSAAGTPPGTTGTFTVPVVNVTSTSAFYTYLSLPIPVGTPVGTYYVTFTGLGSDGTTHSATAKITIS